nr:glycoprotein precursor [Tamdy virus]UCJ02223.1 glycoprotein precursor [Tamdy virus]
MVRFRFFFGHLTLILHVVLCFRQLSAETTGNSTTSSPSTTVSSTTAAVTPTEAPEAIDRFAANVLITAQNLHQMVFESAGYYIQDVINSTLDHVGSWGMPVTTIGIRDLNNNWDLLTLFFYSGRSYEQLVQGLKKVKPSQKAGEKAIKAVYDTFSGLIRGGLRLTTDGLGYPAGQPNDRGTGSAYYLMSMHSGIPKWENAPSHVPAPTCMGTRTIRNQPFKSFNVEVQFDRTEPMVVIAYASAHLGIDIHNCAAVVEHHGNKALLLNTSSYIRTYTSNASLVYPIMHISIDQHNIYKTCIIKVCSIREDHTGNRGSPMVAKPELLTIELTGQQTHLARGGRRKLLSLTDTVLKERCGTGTKVISAIQYNIHTDSSSSPGPYKSICNGTKIYNGYAPPDLGCYSFSRKIAKVQCPTVASAVSKESGDCSYKMITEECPDKHMCVHVSTPGRGTVHIASKNFKGIEDCNRECTFNVPGPEATLTCPNGEKHALRNMHLHIDCPFHRYGNLPLWVCRMSFHPEYIYILISWYFLGYLLWRALLFAMCGLLSMLSRCVRKIRLMGDTTRGFCEMCTEWVASQYHWQRHENCRNGRCPYCLTTMSSDKLKTHPKQCLQRCSKLSEDEEAVTVKLIPFALRASIVFFCAMSKTISKTAWMLGLVVFFYLSIHPVSSLAETTSNVDLWEQEVEFVNFCDISCVQGEDDCTCPITNRVGRKLMGLFKDLQKVSEFLNGTVTKTEKPRNRGTSRSRKRQVDVVAPWGTLHISDTYQPSYSGSHISLSWTESSSSDDHIILNGKSEAIIKLESGTGMMWEISSPKSHESRRVFVSILDFTQVYTTKYLYTTGDRTVGTWMNGRCTGDCPEKCSCKSSLCMFNKYDDFTNWRCNPTWCWSIGQGCACCALSIKAFFSDWLASKWELNYIETQVLACVETSPDDRICQQVAAGTTIQLGPISVQFSDPSGVENRLPKDVMVFHKTPKHDSFDLLDHMFMTDGRSVCDIQSCTHGPVGDFQVYDPTALFDHDHVNANSMGNGQGVGDSNAWMSWSGTNTYYTCHPGHWPDCHSTGVVQNNKEAFQNLYNTGNIGVNWYFHTDKLHMTKPPTFSLKGRPPYGAGQLTALLDVQGLVLKSIKVKPEGLHLDISGCTGCYACTVGFTCSIRVRITHPDQFGVHLMSLDPDVVVPSTTLMAQSDTTSSHELHFFSIVNKKNFCLRVREEDASKGIIRACSSLSLSAPKTTLLEHRITLHSTSNPNCTTGYFSCVASNINSFFSSLGGLLSRVFGSLWGGILSILAIGVVVLLLVFFGPSVFRYLLNCCRRGRGYRRVPEFDSIKKQWAEAQEQVRAEKKRSKAAEDLLIKLSKAK